MPDTVDDTTLAEVMGANVDIRGQRTRATSLGLPYRRFHVVVLRQFFVDIHYDVCAYTLEVSERFSTGCDSRVELVCGSADDGCVCAFHGKKLRAGTVNGALDDVDESEFLTVPMAVLAALGSGLTCSSLNAVMEDGLGLPGISHATFQKHELRWGEVARVVLEDVLQDNILQEAAKAHEHGSFAQTYASQHALALDVVGDAAW